MNSCIKCTFKKIAPTKNADVRNFFSINFKRSLVCSHVEFNDKRTQGKEVNDHTHKTSALIKSSSEIELHERELVRSNDQEHGLTWFSYNWNLRCADYVVLTWQVYFKTMIRGFHQELLTDVFRTQPDIYDEALSIIAKRCLTGFRVLIAPLIESLYTEIQCKGPSLASPNRVFHFVAAALASNQV